MTRFVLTLLASTALAAPAFAAPNTNPAQQPQQPQQQAQMQKPKAQQTPQQPTNKQAQNSQPRKQPQDQMQASNQKPIAPSSLDRSQVRQVQAALDKDGFKAGRADGVWGPHTRTALENFQKSKGMTDNGQLTHGTLAALGVNVNAHNRG